MAIKLGELLVKEGLITNAQLEEGLKCQVIFGGKLGTNLIELGVVTEQAISQTLSRKFGVPAADPEELLHIPQEVVEILPRELAERYEVVPVRLNRRRLSLAMTNPADLKVIDEIAFRTGCIVQPVVAAELCIVLALEKSYGIPRSRRYINITPARLAAAQPPATLPLAPYKEPVLDLGPSPLDVLIEESTVDFSELEVPPLKPEPAHPAPSPPVAPATPPPAPAPPAPQVQTPATPPVQAPAAPAASPPAAAEEVVEELLEEVVEEVAASIAERLITARNRDDILDTLADCLGKRFHHAAVFLVRGDTALGWKCVVEGKSVAGFERVQIPLDEPSVLKTVAETRAVHLGPIPRTPFNSMLLQEMGGRVPERALLVPLLMMGRVVAVLYVDAPGVDLSPYLVQLQKLTAKAAMAFEILVLQNKIISL